MTTDLPCRMAPDVFFARDNERSDSPQALGRIALAKALCSDCPVKLACRDEGRKINAIGIWGGETEEERKAAGYKVANRRRLPSPCGTEAGARRHWRDGQKACPPCAAAARSAKNERDQKRTRDQLTTAA